VSGLLVGRATVVDSGAGAVRSCSPAAVGHHQPTTTSTSLPAPSVYELDHLATFTATGAVPGRLLTAPEGVQRVREMAQAGSVWPLRVQLVIGERELVVVDVQSADEMEHFPLSLVSEPTCATAVDRRVSGCDGLDNLVLFTVLEDPVKKTSPPEMHVFQCVNRLVSDASYICVNVFSCSLQRMWEVLHVYAQPRLKSGRAPHVGWIPIPVFFPSVPFPSPVIAPPMFHTFPSILLFSP